MKKVIFKEYRQYGALICGIFLVIGGIFTLGILSMVPTKLPLIGIIQCLFIPILFIIIGLANLFYGYVYPKTGIKEIIINEPNISITAYNEETTKEYTLNLPISEILSCHVNISCTKRYVFMSAHLDILVDFNIECRDGAKHQILFHTEDYHKIKQIFSVAKYFPNFSYKVDTNAEECEKNILNLARTGKNLSMRQFFSAYFNNPEIPNWQKMYVKILFIPLIFMICFAIFMIASIVKDIF